MTNPSLLILPGDGIGPEVMTEVRKVIDWFAAEKGLAFEVEEDLVGGAAYDVHGKPLADETMEKAQAADAVLLGAVGGPKYDVLDFSVKPERGLLRLRKEMDLFANLRPAVCFDALADFSSLKKDVIGGLDIMIRRLLRRAARRLQGRQRAGGHQHPALHRGRDRPRRPLGLRAGARAQQPRLFHGEGQRDGERHPVARRRPGSP